MKRVKVTIPKLMIQSLNAVTIPSSVQPPVMSVEEFIKDVIKNGFVLVPTDD